MIAIGLLVAVGPALALIVLGALAYWALTHNPSG